VAGAAVDGEAMSEDAYTGATKDDIAVAGTNMVESREG
jgi:hypothetical protein